MPTWTLRRGRLDALPAWTSGEIHAAVRALLAARADRLPRDLDAPIVLKPNLNNDLPALTGNSTDLRVLCAAIEALRERGYRDLTVADGPNVGVERRGIDVFGRLRVDRLGPRYGVRLLDLNRAPARPVALAEGARPAVAEAILDAAFLVTLPKIKTHAEMVLTSACKLHVGVVRGQDKRLVHRDLPGGIVDLVEVRRPDLVLVDGIVGMEGNGPGDGDPFGLGMLLLADDPWACDLAICRWMGLPWAEVPYLRRAADRGLLSAADAEEVDAKIGVLRPIRRAPPRSPLARLAEHRLLHPLKLAARSLVDRPRVAALAHRLRVIQDVYEPQDDAVVGVRRVGTCAGHGRCADHCPTLLSREEIGVRVDAGACIGCLMCWWACDCGGVALDGDPSAIERTIRRYKGRVERLRPLADRPGTGDKGGPTEAP